ncbi:MAG: FtsQ-type POTRA domain-containing protein [Alphaproteobacteria bacterium]|nr:FtsQ-type POTRA domain-containing protein [Alphaproteobacteria bacterium]
MAVVSSKQLNMQEASVYPEHEIGYRVVGFVGAFLLVLSLCLTAITIRDNVFSEHFHRFMQSVYKISAQYGLYVEDIIVEGNQRTSYDELIEALNLSDNESILGIDIAQLQSKIEQLTWVKHCVVKRSFFPNNILVNIEERHVSAIWQYEGRYYPVDDEGNVIEVEDYEPDAPILLLAGEDAPNHLAKLLEVLKSEEELYKRVKAAVFISGRRWNLIFDHPGNGIVVKLPEKNFAEAYKKIALLNKRRGIFKRKLTSFDVRYPNRIIVDIDKSVEDLMFKR